jgi:hypothetical protein
MTNGNGHHKNGNGNGTSSFHPANQYMAVPIAMKAAEPDSAPILPPRPTGRMESAPRQASWKSWPVFVIGIAVVAIIVAVILMVWPPGGSTNADAKTLAPPPAPERMDTNGGANTGPSSGNDPWSNKGGAAPDPAPSQPPANPSVPDIDQIDPPDPDDSLGGTLRGGGRGGMPRTSSMVGMMNAIKKHACDRLASCPNPDDTVKLLCDASGLVLPNTPAPTCDAAKQCLSKVDALPCDDLDPNPATLMQGVQECMEALTSC